MYNLHRHRSGLWLPDEKPRMHHCDPGTIAHNCDQMGLPVPVLAMPMWEGAGDKVYDYSGQGNHGTIQNSNWQPGPGLLFIDNNLEKIDVDGIAETNAKGTVFFSYKYVSYAAYKPLFFTHNSLGINLRNHASRIELRLSGNQFQYSLGAMVIGNSYNIICGWDHANSDRFIFVSGYGLERDSTAFITPAANDIVIGNCPDGTKECNGVLYSVVLFKDLLNSRQVETLNNKQPLGMFEPIRRPPIWSIPSGDTEASLALSQSLGLTESSTATAQAALAVAGILQLASSAQVNGQAGLPLGTTLQVSGSGQAAAQSDLSLAQALAVSDQSAADTQGLLSLAKALELSLSANAATEGLLTLAIHLATTPNYDGAVEVSVAFAQSLGITAQAESSAQAALSLAYQLSLPLTAQAGAEAILTLAAQAGISTTYLFGVEVSLALSQSLGINSTAAVTAEGNLTVSQALAISLLGQTLAQAGIPLDHVQSVALTASSVSATITTPDRRTFTVAIETRTLEVPDEMRTYKV